MQIVTADLAKEERYLFFKLHLLKSTRLEYPVTGNSHVSGPGGGRKNRLRREIGSILTPQKVCKGANERA